MSHRIFFKKRLSRKLELIDTYGCNHDSFVLVLSEAVLVIVIESVRWVAKKIDYDYEHAHEHDNMTAT